MPRFARGEQQNTRRLALERTCVREAHQSSEVLHVGDLLSFDNVRAPWHRGVLRASGLVQPLQWRVRQAPTQGWRVGGIVAVPHLVAMTDSRLRVVRFCTGTTPAQVSRTGLIRTFLDLAVVSHQCRERPADIGAWLAHEDGGGIDVTVRSYDALDRLLRHAREEIRRRQLDRATTIELAAWLN